MKITIELEVDQEAYDAKYGPGSEYWTKYRTDSVELADGTRSRVVKVNSVYEFSEGKVEQALGEMAVEILYEGFYDWRSLREDGSALQVKVNGRQACLCCAKIEGHKDWCSEVAGPEASAEIAWDIQRPYNKE